MQPNEGLTPGQELSASPAARPVNRNNLSARLKKLGTFMNLKERKSFKFTLVTDKEGGRWANTKWGKSRDRWSVHREGW